MTSMKRVFSKFTGERGMVLTVALLVMTMLFILGVVFLSISGTESTIASNEVNTAKTFDIAESGLSHARRYLSEAVAATGFDPLLAGSSGDPPTPVPVATLQDFSPFGAGQGTYSVFVANNTTAYQAIPADPDPQDDTDNRVWVTAIGTYRNAIVTVRGLVEVSALLTPPAPVGALDGSDAGNPVGFNFSGNAFQVTGNDTPSPESAGVCGTPGGPKTGITVESAPALTDLDGAIDSNQEDNVTGVGGNQSIAQDNSMTVAQLQAQKDLLVQQATVTWSGSTTVTSDVGSPTNPVIAYADDHLDLEGNGKGYGILIVERRLRMRGTFKWEGLILLVGQGEFEIEGTAEVYGAVLAVNTGAYSGNSGETRVDIRGNATVAFSSQALCRVSGVMPTTVLAWQQL
ncbi:MAG: hypothetical protein ACE5I9_04510 [Candidatus Methylomirabilales bacterium]